MPNIPTTSNAWTAFAPATLRERNSRSGISGLAMRAWRTTKATSSATATAASASVRVEVRAGLEAQAGARRDQADGEQRGDDADGQVDEEDPVPVDRLGQRAAGEQAD